MSSTQNSSPAFFILSELPPVFHPSFKTYSISTLHLLFDHYKVKCTHWHRISSITWITCKQNYSHVTLSFRLGLENRPVYQSGDMQVMLTGIYVICICNVCICSVIDWWPVCHVSHLLPAGIGSSLPMTQILIRNILGSLAKPDAISGYVG